MKFNPPNTRILFAISLAAFVLIPATAHAATRSKQDNTDPLNLASSWDALPGAADIAQWTSTVTAGNTTASLGADLNWAGIKIVSPGGLVTINSGNTLTVGTSGIDLSTATQDLTLSSGLTLSGGKQSWTAGAGRTLDVAGTFARAGNVVDFTNFNATATLSGIANAGTTGILGPWATTGSGATLNYVKSTAGALSAFTTQTSATAADMSNVTNANVNYSLTPPSASVSSTLTGPISANTLRVTSSMTADTTPAIVNAGNSITLNGLIGVGTRTRISGTGNLVIGATKELVVNWTAGFSAIVCPIIDNPAGASSVTISVGSSVGEWSHGVSGVNSTYSGGTTLNLPTVNSSMCNFFATSFGTGPVTVNGPGMIRSSGGSLANILTLNGGAGLRNGGTYSGPVTVNGASYFSLNNNNLTISGNVSGPGGWSVNGAANLTNSALLSGINTYTGPTTVNNGTLKAGRASMANVSGAFGLNSAVTMANSATARIDLNSFDTQIGSLTGGGPLGGNVINSHASITATLTVGGNNTSLAAYAGLVSGSRLALCKIGSGTLTLSGANTYTGDTVVQNGTLSLNPTVPGGYLSDTADVKLYTGGILDLSTGTTDTIRSLYIDGVGQVTGEWGSAASGAANQSALFTGTGKLNVGTLGSTLTYSISGKVTLNGSGLAGVTVSDGTRSAATAIDGTYSIASVPDNATYTVTASLGGYTFAPSSVSVTVKGVNVTGNNYTATVSGTTYAGWAAAQIPPVSGGENGDSNNDGVQNGIAYFMDDAGLITNPGITGNTVTWPNGGNIPSTEYGADKQFVVQTSPDLLNWTPVDIGDPKLANTANSVSYTLLPPEPGEDKLFVRLVVMPD
jgi:autotransporter-associated beta strand protein